MTKTNMDAINQLNPGDIGLIGICSDHNSSYLRGAAGAPAKIREALHSGSANLCSELGVNLNDNSRFVDLGDRHIGESPEEFLQITDMLAPIIAKQAKPLALGGDHAVSFPLVKAIAAAHGPVNILHFDAHPDIYHDFEGNPYSHASPFARIMEAGLAKRLVQVGIRTLNPHQQEQAKKYNVEMFQMKDFLSQSFKPKFDGPVYISLDIDAIDPAFAPGVSHLEPGGLTSRDVIEIIQAVDAPIVGADLVEFNPKRDINDMTAMLAAKLVKELAGKMLMDQ